MMLMSLLLVLSLERLITKTPNWHIEKYTAQYRAFLQDKGLIKFQEGKEGEEESKEVSSTNRTPPRPVRYAPVHKSYRQAPPL